MPNDNPLLNTGSAPEQASLPGMMPNGIEPGAPAAPAVAGGMPGEQGGATPSMDDLVKALDQTAHLHSAIQQLLSSEDGVSRKKVLDAVANLVDEGVLTPQSAASELSTMPVNDAMLKPWLFMHWKATQAQMSQVSAMITQAQQAPANPAMGAQPAMPNRLLPGGGPVQ